MPKDGFTVFYSWQSDLPRKTNQRFIGDCLKNAIDAIAGQLS
jgi:hypothetical protein